MSRYDWAISFGFERSRYHTSFSTIRFLRVFQANPRVGKADREVELCFNVPKGMSGTVYSLSEADHYRWHGMSG